MELTTHLSRFAILRENDELKKDRGSNKMPIAMSEGSDGKNESSVLGIRRYHSCGECMWQCNYACSDPCDFVAIDMLISNLGYFSRPGLNWS
jgi:hypothetical protein